MGYACTLPQDQLAHFMTGFSTLGKMDWAENESAENESSEDESSICLPLLKDHEPSSSLLPFDLFASSLGCSFPNRRVGTGSRCERAYESIGWMDADLVVSRNDARSRNGCAAQLLVSGLSRLCGIVNRFV
jgi:hypothetical protein